MDLRLVHPLFPPTTRGLTHASSPHSPTEIIAYSEAAKQFEERGAQVVFASVDSEYSLLAWASAARKDGGLGSVNIPLLSDKNHKISKDYGVLLENEGVALRGLFIIDPKGIVRQVWPPPCPFFLFFFSFLFIFPFLSFLLFFFFSSPSGYASSS